MVLYRDADTDPQMGGVCALLVERNEEVNGIAKKTLWIKDVELPMSKIALRGLI